MFNKEIARENDIRILKMANYVETKGTTRHIRSKEEVFRRFAYLKCLVKRGEFANLDELEDSIYGTYGIVDKDLDFGNNSAIIDLINKADNDLKERDEKEQKSNEAGKINI